MGIGLAISTSRLHSKVNKNNALAPQNMPNPINISNSQNVAKNVNSPVIVHQGLQTPTVKQAGQVSRLDRTGGFSQSGNTCYIAVTLQAIRQIPIIRSLLSPSSLLKQKTNESNKKFKLRKEVKQEIYNILKESDEGKTIDVKKFRQFHELLHRYDVEGSNSPKISLPGEGGIKGGCLTASWMF